MAKEEPQRSCIFCRTTRNKQELLRFVVSPDGTLVPDIQGKLPGRGAYTCMNRTCLGNAAAKRQFARSFKMELSGAAPDYLVDLVKTRLEERIASYIALANKAGKVVSGTEQVIAELKGSRRVGMLFIAADISVESEGRFSFLAERGGIDMVRLFSKDALGRLVGKDIRSVVMILDSGFVGAVKQEVEKYRNFLDGGRE